MGAPLHRQQQQQQQDQHQHLAETVEPLEAAVAVDGSEEMGRHPDLEGEGREGTGELCVGHHQHHPPLGAGGWTEKGSENANGQGCPQHGHGSVCGLDCQGKEGAAGASSHAEASGSENAVGHVGGRACHPALLHIALGLVHGLDCALGPCHRRILAGEVPRRRGEEEEEGHGGRRSSRGEEEGADALPHVGLENNHGDHLDSRHGVESDRRGAEVGDDGGGGGGQGGREEGSDGNQGEEGRDNACGLGLDLDRCQEDRKARRAEGGEEAWAGLGRVGGMGWDRRGKEGGGVGDGVVVVGEDHVDGQWEANRAQGGGHGGRRPCPDGCGR